jgi:hypothetical protein
MSDDANNTSRPRVRYEQSPNGEVGSCAAVFRSFGFSPPARGRASAGCTPGAAFNQSSGTLFRATPGGEAERSAANGNLRGMPRDLTPGLLRWSTPHIVLLPGVRPEDVE